MTPIYTTTALITVALTARSEHGLDSAVVWWINFLPVVSIVWLSAKNIYSINIWAILALSIFHYLIFHGHHYHQGYTPQFDFWPASLFSFILITILTTGELRKWRKEEKAKVLNRPEILR